MAKRKVTIGARVADDRYGFLRVAFIVIPRVGTLHFDHDHLSEEGAKRAARRFARQQGWEVVKD